MTEKPFLKDRLIDALKNTLDALSQVRDCHDCIRIWEARGVCFVGAGPVGTSVRPLIDLLTEKAP